MTMDTDTDDDDLGGEGIMVDGQSLSMADLAGVQMGEVEARFQTKCPAGIFHLRVESSEIDTRIKDDKKQAIIKSIFVVQAIEKLADANLAEEDVIEKAKHIDTSYLSTESAAKMMESLGYFKGHVQLTGAPSSGDLQSVLDNWVGTVFRGKIKHRKNPNDADEIWVNLDWNKVQPLAPAQQPQAAAA